MRLTQPQPAGRRDGGPAPAAEGAPAGRGAGAAANDGLDATGSNPQATPIVVGGVMYLPARGNQVLAIEAHTGKEVWRYQQRECRSNRRFRAFDSKTGKELCATRVDGQVNANPMTYQGKDGKQYVAVVATDTLVAFSLKK